MKRWYVYASMLMTTILVMGLSVGAWGWDSVFDGSVLPNDLSLGASRWDVQGGTDGLSMCSSDGNMLRIVDDSTAKGIAFSRPATPANSPLTIEARLRVASGQSTILYAGTPSYTPYLQLYPDHLAVWLAFIKTDYMVDLTSWHTIRLATAVDGGSYTSYVWVDDTLAAQGPTGPGGNQDYVMFGSPWHGMGESYWDYVAYSASFEPLPEPSSLSLLALALASVGVGRLRRRR